MTARRALVFSILLFFAFVPSSPADVFDELVRDFAPISGYVVMPADGGFLIDQDAASGIAVGDLFSVVHPGKKIVHPVTGKVLGTLDRVKGFLQVSQVKSGYSHARPLDVKEEIVAGDVIRRFEHLPTAFLDTTGRGRPIFDRIRTALPGMEWRYSVVTGGGTKPSFPEGAMLAFFLGPDGLEVRGPDRTLRSYEVPGELRRPPTPASTGSGKERPKEPGLSAGQGKGVRNAASADFVVRGALPEGTRMADFVRDGDRLLLAATDGTRIGVFAVGDNLVPVATGDAPRSGHLYSLHWWQPQPDAPPLLAANIAVEENRAYSPTMGQTVMGVLFALREGRLVPIREGIPYLLGSFDRDGDGVRETLLGQSFDRDTFFGGNLREVSLVGGELVIGKPSFPISLPFTVQGALFADLTGDGRPETVFVRNRTLFVYRGTDLLYESSRQMGGSQSVLTYDVNPGAKDRLFTTAAFEVPPVAVDLGGDGRMQVVAIASEGSGTLGIGSGVRKSWLSTLDYRDGRFVRGSLGPELETPLQGLYADREGVYVVATQPSSYLARQKKSSLLLFLPLPPPRE
ncbi:MAG: hypothetical protein ACXW4K_11120 [Candidatus Deferrimicrobiaceae bacterium]